MIEVAVSLGLGGMRFENIGHMEMVAMYGGRLGLLLALAEQKKSTLFLNPRVEYLSHITENIGNCSFVYPSLNLGFMY